MPEPYPNFLTMDAVSYKTAIDAQFPVTTAGVAASGGLIARVEYLENATAVPMMAGATRALVELHGGGGGGGGSIAPSDELRGGTGGETMVRLVDGDTVIRAGGGIGGWGGNVAAAGVTGKRMAARSEGGLGGRNRTVAAADGDNGHYTSVILAADVFPVGVTVGAAGEGAGAPDGEHLGGAGAIGHVVFFFLA